MDRYIYIYYFSSFLLCNMYDVDDVTSLGKIMRQGHLSHNGAKNFLKSHLNIFMVPLRQLKVAILKWPIPLVDSLELCC